MILMIKANILLAILVTDAKKKKIKKRKINNNKRRHCKTNVLVFFSSLGISETTSERREKNIFLDELFSKVFEKYSPSPMANRTQIK